MKQLIITALFLTSLVSFGQKGTETLNKFIKGEREVFLSDGLPKAKGLKLRMEYPKGWSSRDGKRPHILQFFKSPDLFEMAMIAVIPLTDIYSVSETEIPNYKNQISEELLSSEAIKQSALINNDIRISEFKFSKVYINGSIDAGLGEYKLRGPSNAGLEVLTFYYHTYHIVYDKYFIQLSFNIQQHTKESDVAYNQRIQDWYRMLKLMANSLIIFD